MSSVNLNADLGLLIAECMACILSFKSRSHLTIAELFNPQSEARNSQFN